MMEVSFVVSKANLSSLFGYNQGASVSPIECVGIQPEQEVNIKKRGYLKHVVAAVKGDSAVQMIEDIATSKQAEEYSILAAENLWKDKLADFEARSTATARKIARQWQKDHKSIEQIIDENLAENQDMFEKATALRIQFEMEKQQWESEIKRKLLNESAPIVYYSGYTARQSNNRRADPTNYGPPFMMFSPASEKGQAMEVSGNHFEYEVNEQDCHYDNKENVASSWSQPCSISRQHDFTRTNQEPHHCDSKESSAPPNTVQTNISKKRKFSFPFVCSATVSPPPALL